MRLLLCKVNEIN